MMRGPSGQNLRRLACGSATTDSVAGMRCVSFTSVSRVASTGND